LREQPKTIAILGADAVVENALAQLLEGEGYSTKVLKPFPMREALEEGLPPGGVDLVVLAPQPLHQRVRCLPRRQEENHLPEDNNLIIDTHTGDRAL
jgi:hypothetical protein